MERVYLRSIKSQLFMQSPPRSTQEIKGKNNLLPRNVLHKPSDVSLQRLEDTLKELVIVIFL